MSPVRGVKQSEKMATSQAAGKRAFNGISSPKLELGWRLTMARKRDRDREADEYRMP
jgi:hypothetical protein